MGLEGGALLIDRRTVPGSAMWTVMWGGRVDAVLDLVPHGDSGAVYFATGVSAQALTTAPFPVTVATGFCYRLSALSWNGICRSRSAASGRAISTSTPS